MNKNTEQTSKNIFMYKLCGISGYNWQDNNILAAKYVNIVTNIWYVEPCF